jgi:hypothetical protein
MRRLALALALACPAAASAASTLETDLAVGRVDVPQATGGPARATYVGFNIGGSAELIEERLTLDFALASLKDEGTTLHFLGQLGLELTPDDHWSFEATGAIAPTRSSTYPLLSDAKQSVDAAPVAHVDCVDSSLGLSLSASYDTAGESDFETAVDAQVGVMSYRVDQAARGANGRVLKDASGNDSVFRDTITQWRLSAGATETFSGRTDLALRAGLYLYDRPPTDAGFVRLQRLQVVIGSGLPAAPLSWEVRPAIAHRFSSAVGASLLLGAGRYHDRGSMLLATLRPTVRLHRTVRLFALITFQRDGEPAGSGALWSRYFGLGAECRF